jgi:hypothetical protein
MKIMFSVGIIATYPAVAIKPLRRSDGYSSVITIRAAECSRDQIKET